MFITFEGIEGSSKTTQAKLLAKWLESKNIDHLLTKEPGTVLSRECQEIRHLLLNPENDLDSRAELFLYLADRAQHVQKCIKPALESGKWVISDRFSFSTYAYQGHGRGHKNLVDREWFDEILKLAAYNIVPKFIFLMDLPVEIGLSRARSSNDEFSGGDRMEREAIEFHQKIREGFLEAKAGFNKYYPSQCVIMDATKSIEELHEEVKKVLLPFIG